MGWKSLLCGLDLLVFPSAASLNKAMARLAVTPQPQRRLPSDLSQQLLFILALARTGRRSRRCRA